VIARNDGVYPAIDLGSWTPPAAGFDERDEALDHFVEQCGLFEIEHVVGFREEGQTGGGQMAFQRIASEREDQGGQSALAPCPLLSSRMVGTPRFAHPGVAISETAAAHDEGHCLRITVARTASRYPTASTPHRSGARGCIGRSSACLPSHATARSSLPA
jgi:hypothetical protein